MPDELDRPRELLDPRSGELLPATPATASRLLDDLRDLRARLLDPIRACEAVLIDESVRVGSKTLRFEGYVAEISGGSDIVWDVERLRADLRAAGCPEERLDDLITETVEYKVNATVARQLAAANPDYAAAVEAAKTRNPRTSRVRVTHK